MELTPKLKAKVKEVVEKGGVLAKFYFDIHARSKDAVEKLAVALGQQIANEKGLIFSISQIAEVEESQGISSTYMEALVLAEKPRNLFLLAMKYSPVSVEVLEPKSIEMSFADLEEVLMDVAQTTYDYKAYIYKNVAKGEDKKRILASIANRMKIAEELLKGGKGDK